MSITIYYRTSLAVLLFGIAFQSTAQLNDATVRDLKGGQGGPDSSFVYSLPFEVGRSYLLIQGYNSGMSHENEIALDFKMKKGSKVCAARGGVVVSIKKDSDKGGLKDKHYAEGNYIIIVHDDGTNAYYWHLQKDGVLVQLGDTVEQGQVIGRSGNTGYTAFPHLHFEVTGNNDSGGYRQLPTRFYTKSGIRYLRPGKWYRSVVAAN